MYSPYGQAQSPFNVWKQQFQQQPQRSMPQLAAPQPVQPMPQAAPQGDPWAAKAALEAQHARPAAPAVAQPAAPAQDWWAQNPAFGGAIRSMLQSFGGMRQPMPTQAPVAPAPASPEGMMPAMPAPPAMSPASAAHLENAQNWGRSPWARSFNAPTIPSPNWGRSPWAQAQAAPANTSFSMAPATAPAPVMPETPKAFARGGLACKPMKRGGRVDYNMLESTSARPIINRTPAERAAVVRGNRNQALELADEGVLPPRMRRPAPIAKACGGLAVMPRKRS